MRLKYDPHMLIVDQTTLCNEACDFCWRRDEDAVNAVYKSSPVKTMPWGVFAEIVDQASHVETLRTFNVCGPMGDATLVPDLVERGEYAKARGFRLRMLNTNGVALDKHDMAALQSAFTDIKVSLDTLDPAKYKYMHGRDSLDRVLTNIRAMRAAGGNFSVKVTITPDNEDEVSAIEAWTKSVGVRLYKKRLHSFIDVIPDKGSAAGAAACDQPTATVNFDFRGRLTTCCINHKLEPTFGTLGSLKDLWESDAYEVWRSNRLNGLCKGCSGLGPGATKAIAEETN